jgi:hypothetical protein
MALLAENVIFFLNKYQISFVFVLIIEKILHGSFHMLFHSTIGFSCINRI